MKLIAILAFTLLFVLTGCRTSQPEKVTRDLARLHARAERGNAGAQYALGRAYAEIWNAQEASKWYRKAGEQGVAEAQYALGQLYATGEGVSRDVAEAYAWFSLAAAQELRLAVNARNTIIRKMSRVEIEEGNQRAFELVTQHPRAKGTAKSTGAEVFAEPATPKHVR